MRDHNGVLLYDRGYTDLVLIRPHQKAPAFKGWLYETPSRAAVRGWHGNIGLIAEKFPAIDIDLHDEAMAKEVALLAVEHLGNAPLRLSYRPASLMLPYRTDIPFKKKVLHLPDSQGLVEVLGAGRQYIVVGEHPEGPPHYRWAGRPLWEVDPSELSLTNESDVEQFLSILAEKYGGVIGRASAASDVVLSSEELEAPSPEHVERVMADMPNSDAFLRKVLPEMAHPRDYWVAIGHAIKGACGDVGEDIFAEWTSRYEDGAVDLDNARHVYAGLLPERYGWPTLDRIHREHLDKIDAEDEFEAEPLPEGMESPAPTPYAVYHSDEYMTDRLAPKLMDSLCFSGSWMYWDGERWVMDTTKDNILAEGLLREELREWGERMIEQAFHAPTKEEANQLRSRAKAVMSRHTMRTLLDHLMLRLHCPVEEFNQDPMALNTPGGLFNLEDGSFNKTSPADRVSHITAVAPAETYDPDAAPHWEDFLDHLVDGDDDLRAFLQRYVGYCLTGRMDEKKFVFAWGAHSNTGKSTFINAIAHVMGTYAHTDNVKLVMGGMGATRKEQGLARLFGARLFHATEPSVGQKWDDEVIKQITGNDPVTARLLYKEPFDYHPQFKLLIGGNHEPELEAVDTPFLKRILVVPMNHVVPEAKMDRLLGQKLEGEASHILRWMMDGTRDWLREGLAPPTSVMDATREYQETEDVYSQFAAEVCDFGEDYKVATADLYMHWKTWNGDRGRRAGGLTAFARAVSAHADDWGIDRYRTSDERGYTGMRIKPKVFLGTDEFHVE